MTDLELTNVRDRLYQAYVSQHAGAGGDEAAALVYRRAIPPLLPRHSGGSIVDLDCGHGALVQLLQADGYNAEGIDISAEQVTLAHEAGLTWVRQGDFRLILAGYPAHYAAITATDLLEHLTRAEVLQTFDDVAAAGFASVLVRPSPPFAHGLASAARVVVWQAYSAFYKLALAAETCVLHGHIVIQNLTFAARNGSRLANSGGR